jgi:FkbM family methyltransferase
MEAGIFEASEVKIFDSIVKKFDLLINVGANNGYYVCKALSKGVEVIAFEPDQLNVNKLLRNIDANKFAPSFQLFPIALSDRTGVLPLYGALTGASLIEGWAGQYDKKLVPISTFDKTASSQTVGKNCFIVVDVEGGELNFLKGAKTLLSSNTNNCFFNGDYFTKYAFS